ncbi:HAMP domain-containing histidine kinase [Campylobacter sp. LR264d]|uniref:sensor histidine kinase n=1 Tax=Campylobacter sp. LR264d TaxID=2593544 RepID=UPI0012386A3C|nr:HAMP domain-containing sensor histidine kinase [Campylobacter sp. LR264d]KAA6233847.1 HAMP domain-containing histidine kinase [Campylobacter sp. LR264d]
MSEAKRVIRQILLIYLTTTGIFLAIFFSIWYAKFYEELINNNSLSLRQTHRNIAINIQNARFIPLEESTSNVAKSSNVKFALFDDNKIFFNNLDINLSKAKNAKTFYGKGMYDNFIFYIAPLNSHEFSLIQGIKESPRKNELQILVQGENAKRDIIFIWTKVLGGALISFIILAIIAYILVKIALKPLEEKINTLNRFIKDSTHEINTPLSVILMSIEQLEKQNLEESAKFKRIKLAAKTLTQVFSDLIFYNFPSTLTSEKEEVNLEILVKERLEFFDLFFKQKKLEIRTKLESEIYIFINKSHLSKLIDNLLSNAVKYNKKGGFIEVILSKNSLSIGDSGCGIDKKNLKNIFEYYTRFNQDQGGFGIGLSLVKKVCKDNNIKIHCESVKDEGTIFTLNFEPLKRLKNE